MQVQAVSEPDAICVRLAGYKLSPVKRIHTSRTGFKELLKASGHLKRH